MSARSAKVLLGAWLVLSACSPGLRSSTHNSGGAAGGAGAGGASSGSRSTRISCEAWHREPIFGSRVVLINNEWNEAWANGQPHEQCLLAREDEQGSQYGWSWAWPALRPGSSYAAPEALFGWKAWDGGTSTTPSLPKRIDGLASLTVDFAVTLSADDTHNLNTTMWLTNGEVATAAPNPDDITNEVMVWFDNPAGFAGGDTRDGSVMLGGLTFDVWHQVNHRDGSGGTTHTWTMVTYISQGRIFESRFDLSLVLRDIVARGLAAPTYAVGGIELITEIFGGSGELWLKRFDVEVIAR